MENNQLELDDEIEIDIKELVMQVLSYWHLILLAMILAGGLGFVVSKFIMVPEYESTAELYVMTKSTSITSLSDIQTSTSLTNDYIVVVKGRPVLEQVIKNLGIDETYQSLKDKVTLNNPSNSRLLDITVKDTDSLRAKTIADEIADVSSAFIAEKMDQAAPEVIQYGYADGEPVSPSTKKNTAIAGLLGAFIVIAIIVISYLFNDSIMEPEDIEKKLGMNVLGSLPLEESEDDGDRKRRNRRKKSA